MKFRISPEARRDLRGIAVYIARDNPSRAVSFVAELSLTILATAAGPMSFPARDDLLPGLRGALHKPYIVFFRQNDGLVEVVRVLHGARDIDSLF
jgi:toxin ParE1/3/4